MNKSFKIAVFSIASAFMLTLAGCSDASSSSQGASSPDAAAPKEKSYVKVFEFKGNGKKKSSVFELHGGHARLKYNYNSENDIAGIFSVYVTPDGEDVMETGGVPEIMVTSLKEKDESAIQKSAGKYYLDVNAEGKWSITVEEEQ